MQDGHVVYLIKLVRELRLQKCFKDAVFIPVLKPPEK